MNLALPLGEIWHAIHYEILPTLILEGEIKVYADFKGFAYLTHTNFDQSTYPSFQEALDYARIWIGDPNLTIELNTPIQTRYLKTLEIRKI